MPSPAVRGVHPTLPVVLLEQVAGEAGFTKLDTAEQVAIIDDFVPWLSLLHSTDATTLELPSLGPVKIVSPHVADPYAARRLRSMARVVKYLREENRVGDAHLHAELDDLSGLLGSRPTSISAGSADLLRRVIDRSISAVDLLPHAYAQVIRRQQVVCSSMGVLAVRHLPKI